MTQTPRVEFSFRGRIHNLARLRAEMFDLLIVGGGINGCGIARDAAIRGYKVCLVERDDFASGTSSKSSKLVHGGLRYLESFEFPLVYEASRERRLLNRLAPNLVRPLPFLYPIYRGARYGPFLTRLGFTLYDGLALFRNFGPHHMLSTSQLGSGVAALDTWRVIGGASYYDAQTDDARLTLENARAAHRHGAAVVNHFQIDSFSRGKAGKLNGARGHDRFSGEEISIRARIVVNAAGPWVDKVIQLDDPQAAPRLRPTKGVHLYIPRARFPLDAALSFQVPSDGRLMFVIPWGSLTLVGTTDTFFNGSPDQVSVEPADVAYILRSINEAFPRAQVGPGDVISAYAGLRPLVSDPSNRSPGSISREHKIWKLSSGLVNIAGGKLTTYRSMSAELVDSVATRLRQEFRVLGARSQTALLPLVEPEPGNERSREAVARTLPQAVREHLSHFYGVRAGRVLDYISQSDRGHEPIVEGLPYLWAEVPHAIENEMALTLGDILGRRLHLLYEAPDGGAAAAPRVLQELETRLDLSESQMDRELEAYHCEVASSRRAVRELSGLERN